jgi:hypothetical protein
VPLITVPSLITFPSPSLKYKDLLIICTFCRDIPSDDNNTGELQDQPALDSMAHLIQRIILGTRFRIRINKNQDPAPYQSGKLGPDPDRIRINLQIKSRNVWNMNEPI